MITEINIYTDTTVISLDEYKCLVPIASGNWDVIKDIYQWLIDPYPGRLPDECKINHCDIFIVDRNNPNNKIPLTIHNFKKIGKYLSEVNRQIDYVQIVEDVVPLIVENYERE